MRARLIMLTALVATLGPNTGASAHSGAYRGPADFVRPDCREPNDPVPPRDGRGTTPPKSGAALTGPTGHGRARDGPDPLPPPPPRDLSALHRSRWSRFLDYRDWTFWWNVNKDAIVLDRRRFPVGEDRSGAVVRVFGCEMRTHADGALSSVSMNGIIVPALRELAGDEALDFEIRAAAILGLAKIGDDTQITMLLRLAQAGAGDDGAAHRTVRESATLALGILGTDTPEVRNALLGLLADDSRRSDFVRQFAAVALGLLAQGKALDDRTIGVFLDVLARAEPTLDTKLAVLLAIGMTGDVGTVPVLLHMLEHGRTPAADSVALSDIEISFVVDALGRIGLPRSAGSEGDDGDVVAALIKTLSPSKLRRAAIPIPRSAVPALGRILPHCQESLQREVLHKLMRVQRDDPRAFVRSLALVALGRAAADEGTATKIRTQIGRVLRARLAPGERNDEARPFAALALALSTGERDADEANVCRPLRKVFESIGVEDPRQRSALAVAQGIAKDRRAVPGLLDVLRDPDADPGLRGYAALGLGMIGAPSAQSAVRQAMGELNAPSLRIQATLAAGLLDGDELVTDLIAVLCDEESPSYASGSAALALGHRRDERAVAPLLEIARDVETRHDRLTRAFAVVALGRIAERRNVPALARVLRDLNYRTLGRLPALAELITIL